jgi:hypothetical protein
VLSQNGSGVGVDFAERDGSHSGSLEAETESADAAEQVEDIHHPRLASSLSRYRIHGRQHQASTTIPTARPTKNTPKANPLLMSTLISSLVREML